MLSMAEIAWIGHGLTSSDLGLRTWDPCEPALRRACDLIMLSILEARIERECPYTCSKECYPLPVKLKSGVFTECKTDFQEQRK